MEKDVIIIGHCDAGSIERNTKVILEKYLPDLKIVEPKDYPEELKKSAKRLGTVGLVALRKDLIELACRAEEELARNECVLPEGLLEEVDYRSLQDLKMETLKEEESKKPFIDASDFNVKRNRPKWMK